MSTYSIKTTDAVKRNNTSGQTGLLTIVDCIFIINIYSETKAKVNVVYKHQLKYMQLIELEDNLD